MTTTRPTREAPARRRGFDPGRRPDPERLAPHWQAPTAPAGWSASDCRQAAWRCELAYRRVHALPRDADMPAVAAAAGKDLALVMIPIEATRFDVEDALDVAAGRWWAVAAHADRAARRGQKRASGWARILPG